jgi:chromosome segregation ATPase|tara:strand:+ start:176 stop:421 length:246 start_codon:yes stop_codon:yes gene_type:complete
MTKITEQEIEKVKGLRVKFDQLINTIGQVEVQLYNLQEQKKELQMSLLNIQQEELTLAKELEEKYGKGTVSLDTGEFSPTE